MTKHLGKKKLIKDVSANTVQTIITQVFGLLIFYITSRYLSKSDFGEFNWSLAVGSTIIAIASLGLDLVFVKRVASGQDVLTISSIHLFHTLCVGLFLGAAVFVLQLLVPSFTNAHPLFFFVFLNLAIANVANSFKLCLNGLESYRSLALLALCSNLFKLLGIFALYYFQHFSMTQVIFIYLLTSVIELLLGYRLLSKSLNTRIKPLLRISDYRYFILESLPQLGVVLFDSALARIDWILLGIISTAAITAEYSFTYKVFELSKLPLLIIAPVLLTRFSKLLSGNTTLSDTQRQEIRLFFRLELVLIMLIPITLFCAWTPLMDILSAGKYGAVNELTFQVLASCVPLSGIINFLWTIGFIQGRLKTIMWITIGVSLSNIMVNALLIPFYGSLGAAMAFLFCTLLQTALYLVFIKHPQVSIDLNACLWNFANAILAVLAAKLITASVLLSTFSALFIFVLLSLITRQLNIKQLRQTLTKAA